MNEIVGSKKNFKIKLNLQNRLHDSIPNYCNLVSNFKLYNRIKIKESNKNYLMKRVQSAFTSCKL